MKTQVQGDTLRVSEVAQLGAAHAKPFRDSVRSALGSEQKNIDVDLSQTTFMDSCGLGALIELNKSASRRNGRLRVINPQPPVRQILELTQMHRLFEIVGS